MEASRRLIQTVRVFLAGAVVMYLFVILRIPSSTAPNPVVFRAIGVVAIIEAVLIFAIRRVWLLHVELMLETQPQNPNALLRWRKGYIVTYALSLAIALYGVVLHFLGFSLSQISPFFLAGFVLIVFIGPRRMPNGRLPSQEGPIVPR